jgi:hypothetical protein
MKTAIGHTNVYSSYGWLILAVMVLYVPNGYGSFLCLVYATSHLLFGVGALIFQKFGQRFPTPA